MINNFGLLLIAKPSGITSFDVIRRLRRILNIRKLGHAGTLDPFASGLMIIGVNRGTKLLPRFLGAEKHYRAELCFGVSSTTDDPEGEKTAFPDAPSFSQEALLKALPEFIGTIRQVPPLYSALKMQGKRASDRARAGQDISAAVEAKAREITIFALDLESFSWPLARINVHCSSGTYVRSLARDLGTRLGTVAYVSALERTQIAGYSLNQAKAPEDVTEADIFMPPGLEN